MSYIKDKNENYLKNMLMSFRIAELQMLLGSCGRSRSGRKHELLGRAISLLKSSSGNGPVRDKVKTRILELYHQRYPSNTEMGSSTRVQSYAQPYMQYFEKDDEHSTYLNRPNHVSPPPHKSKYSNNELHHPQHVSYQPRELHPALPVHPDVQFIPLPFYDMIDVLIKPTSLVQKTLTGYQEMTIVYHLTPYQAQLITNSRAFNVKSMVEYGVQVQLRFCLAETSCVQEDLYPSRLKVILNNKSCPIPGQPPPTAQNQEPRKPHRPINITPINISPLQSNQITIQWMPSEMGIRHTATVHLVKTMHCETLIQQLRNKPERSAEHTKAFIMEKLRQDPDSEIALTSLKVSLCCPIGKTRMAYPCRANNCNHLQCFDGATYIQMNERKPSWVCPVCDKKAHYNQLFKDGMFSSIIKQESNCDDIVFFQDGSWRPLADVQDNQKPLSQQLLSTPQGPNKIPPALVECKTPPLSTPVVVISKTSGKVPAQMPVLQRMSSSTSLKPAEEAEVEIISIDSDTDEEPPVPLSEPCQSQYCSEDSSFSPPPLITSPSPPLQTPNDNLSLTGMELYNMLPHEDRIAAAMYLDQAGFIGQIANSRTSPSSIIDISE